MTVKIPDLNNISFEQIPHHFLTYGEQLSKAEAILKILEKEEKSTLAKVASNSDGKNEAERNRIALISPEYDIWREGYKEAIQERLTLRYICNALEMRFEYMRSVNALNRVKTQLQ